MMKKRVLLAFATVFTGLLIFSCSEENGKDKAPDMGQVNIKVTDAPSDDANIQGTFITVSEVHIDGKAVEGFHKQTIDISAYQNGETKTLFSDQIEAKSYNSLTLVLDYETDDAGNSPGCYVLTDDDTKHDLSASAESEGEITFSNMVDVMADQTADIVVDFDLRKTIQRNEEDAETDYSFVSSAEMNAGIRMVMEDECGSIDGYVENQTSAQNEVIVYAYKKGEFNAETETDASGKLLFANAVTSAKVQGNGNYELNFLEEGDYEIHVATYSESDDKLVYSSIASAVSLTSALTLNDVSVDANASVDLNIQISVLF